MKLAFALLAHGNPQIVARLIRLLLAEGHSVALHYDLKSPAPDYEELVRAFAGCEAVCFARRVRVFWGQWSIPAATLNCLDAIAEAGWEPDYVYYLSGMDYPIRPSEELLAFLERHRGTEFIESVPADRVRWARTGPQEERYQYRFPFSWRDQPRRFALFLALQKKLGWKRKFVRGMTPYIGSQWWVLTWPTLQKVMELGREPDVRRFFRSTLVPDELFFQTLVRHLVPHSKISSRTLTLYQFSDYGVPLVYYLDHLEYLLRQPCFMARKLSPRADALRDALDECWHGERAQPPFEDAQVGKVGPEYETHRAAYRGGAPGLPGRPLRRWYGALDSLRLPYFVVVGSSAAELRLVYRLLSRQPELRCHGQLFHEKRIEFADGRASFAGYPAQAVKLRAIAKANFLADVVRAEKERLSGFLLLWGQGQPLVRLLFERPGARVVLLRGDPIISFSEEILGRELFIDEPYDPALLEAIPPALLAARFRRFLADFRHYRKRLRRQAKRAALQKPKGWITELNLVAGAGRRRPRVLGARANAGHPSTPSEAQLEKALAMGLARNLTGIAHRGYALGLLRPAALPPAVQKGLREEHARDSKLLPTLLSASEELRFSDLSIEFALLKERRRMVLRRLLAADSEAFARAADEGEEPQIAIASD